MKTYGDKEGNSTARTGIEEFLHPTPKPAEKGYSTIILRIPMQLYGHVDTYLSSAGLDDNEGIMKLLQFGLGLRDEGEFDALRGENTRLKDKTGEKERKLGGSKLDAYENLLENKTLAVQLASLLSENRLLHDRMSTNALLNEYDGEWIEKLAHEARRYLSKYTFQPKL